VSVVFGFTVLTHEPLNLKKKRSLIQFKPNKLNEIIVGDLITTISFSFYLT